MTLSGTTGLDFSFATDANGTGTGTGTDETTMTFRGTVADINAALDGMVFTPTAGYSGYGYVDMLTNDLGGNSSGSPLTAEDAVYITINPITVTNVSSTTSNGTYGTGSTIYVTVTFNEAMTVTGTPQLTLATGATDETANYTSGSGTDTLTFAYTVSSGDSSAHLEYPSTSALALNGGTIEDSSGSDALLTLPTPGGTGSLSANSDIIIDTATVSDVSATSSDAAYTVGDSVYITISFSEAVYVTGTPQLALNSGGTASYSSGSGTSTLTFTYTVGSGDTSSDLDYSSTSALTLAGGTIQDLAGNNAALTLPATGTSSLPGKNIVIDTTAPTVTGVGTTTSTGTYNAGAVIYITITFSEDVVVSGTPTLSLNSGGTAYYSSGSGTNTLTFAYTVATGDSCSDLDYASTSALSLSGGTIQDAAGNNATLTLPSVGASSLPSRDIVIDAPICDITNVSSTRIGTHIKFTIDYSDTSGGIAGVGLTGSVYVDSSSWPYIDSYTDPDGTVTVSLPTAGGALSPGDVVSIVLTDENGNVSNTFYYAIP